MILLDTHVLVWLLLAPEKLSAKEKKLILTSRKSGLALSAISLWEIAWLVQNQRIKTNLSAEMFVKKCASYVHVLPITQQIAVRSVQFSSAYPSDPQDRIIGATSIAEGIRLLTHDKRIVKSAEVPLAV